MYNELILYVYLLLMMIMSIISFTLYGVDKKKAIKGKERIKEKTLLFYTIFNGAIGAFFARFVFRHKTEKKYFSLTIFAGLFIQVVGLAILYYLAFFMVK